MLSAIVEFAEVLRQNGIRCGSSDVADAVRAAEAVGVSDKVLFRAALKATLVKSVNGAGTFDRAFDFYFGGGAGVLSALEASLVKGIEEGGFLKGDELTMVLAQLSRLGGEMTPLTEAVLRGDVSAVVRLMRNAVLQLDLSQMESSLQSSFFTRRLLAAMGIDAAHKDLNAVATELKSRGVSADGVEFVSKTLNAALRSVEAAARAEIQEQVRARIKATSGALEDKPLALLTPDELESLQKTVRTMGQKLKSRMTRRLRKQRRGQLHPRRTLRRNLTWGGTPMVPVFRSKRPARPELLVLCDLSDSVRNTARLMLLFMHALQSLYSRVRCFVFVSEISEVTQAFREARPEEVIDVISSGAGISLQSNSNYGRAFQLFMRTYGGSLTRRSTVIVIGDGRNNYNANGLADLQEIKRRSKRLLWICPEAEAQWGFGDSEMRHYAQVAHQVSVARTVGDLASVADHLIPL